MKLVMMLPTKTPRNATTASEGIFRRSMIKPIRIAMATIERDENTFPKHSYSTP
jgi:hypothetical protein